MQISWFIQPVWKWPWQKWYNYDKVMASTWIRCLQLIPYLDKLGIKSQINTWNDRTNIAVFLRRWEKRDRSLALKLKNQGMKIIVDTPVNYFSAQDIPPFKGAMRDQFLAFADICDTVFCSSHYTAQFGERLEYNTVCMEDSIDFDHFCYRKDNHNSKGKSVLVWSGVSVKADVLNFLASPISCNNWPVIIIADKKPCLDFEYEFIKWGYRTFPHDILKGDIGIFPRSTDNEYDMGHSFFKIGVFLAQHVPVLCRPLPSYKQIIIDSNVVCENSFDADLWEKSIHSIISQEKVFDFRQNPVRDFSTQKIASKYVTTFSEMLE